MGSGDSEITLAAVAPGVPEIGDRILRGRYEIESVLGAGGMSVVLAARDREQGTRVAFKFLTPSAVEDDKMVERFLREGRAVGRIETEHVARVFESGLLPTGIPFHLMEHLSGMDFAALVAQSGALPTETAVGYVLEACAGVVAAHGAGIIHRDLKPSNIFLAEREDGTTIVKVLDFGVSKVMRAGGDSERSLTTAGMILGSPQYAAPEQLRDSKDVDARVDVWALGLVLHELVTGMAVFRGESLIEIWQQILSSAPAPLLRSVDPNASAALERIIARCIEKEPANRYRSVAELAGALQALRGSANGPTAEKTPAAEPTLVAQERPEPPAIPKLYDEADEVPVDRTKLLDGHKPASLEKTELLGAGRTPLVAGRYALHGKIAMRPTATRCFARVAAPEGGARTVVLKRLEATSSVRSGLAFAARFRHPNVVATIDFVADDGALDVVTEYVRGASLAELEQACHARGENLPVGVLAAIVRDVLRGLHAAHESGLPTHGALSTRSVLVGEDGVARVCDLAEKDAAATATDADQAARQSPEQLAGDPLDRRTDVFAASVLLWESLTGKRLFLAETPAKTIHNVLRMPITPPSLERGRGDHALDAIVLKGLARAPNARFATAGEMADALALAAVTGPPPAISAWLRTCMGSELAARAARARAIEALGAADLPVPSAPSASGSARPYAPPAAASSSGPRHSLPDAAFASSPRHSLPDAAPRPAPSRDGRLVAGAVVFFVVAVIAAAVVAFGTGGRVEHPREAPAPVTPSSSR